MSFYEQLEQESDLMQNYKKHGKFPLRPYCIRMEKAVHHIMSGYDISYCSKCGGVHRV